MKQVIGTQLYFSSFVSIQNFAKIHQFSPNIAKLCIPEIYIHEIVRINIPITDFSW